jgi:hypothetical protein
MTEVKSPTVILYQTINDDLLPELAGAVALVIPA